MRLQCTAVSCWSVAQFGDVCTGSIAVGAGPDDLPEVQRPWHCRLHSLQGAVAHPPAMSARQIPSSVWSNWTTGRHTQSLLTASPHAQGHGILEKSQVRMKTTGRVSNRYYTDELHSFTLGHSCNTLFACSSCCLSAHLASRQVQVMQAMKRCLCTVKSRFT
jgi:hypothetical protein